jgi:hypothetical protein
MPDLRVLYLVAKGRSGSNILAHVLGQLDGYENLGELYLLWRWGLVDAARCGCGRPTPDCPLWAEVVTDPAIAAVDPRDAARWQDAVLSWLGAPRVLAHRHRPADWPELARTIALRGALYRRVAEVSGARVLVDASKWPWDPAVLGMIQGVDVRVVHLTRDPRAVAHSWRRRRTWGDQADTPTEMPRFSPAASTASWMARNAVTEAVHALTAVPWRHERYEDLASDPAGTVGRITAHAGVPASLPLLDTATLDLQPTHGIGGNPSKFQSGPVTLRLDDEWETAMPARDRRLVSVIAGPLRGRYGYR